MSTQAYNDAAPEDRHHFMRCECCYEWLDCRSLDEVFSHATDHEQYPDIMYNGFIKIEFP